MKRDFSAVMKDYDGRARFRPIFLYDEAGSPVVKDGQQEIERFEKLTLRVYALDALAAWWPGEERTIPNATRRAGLYDKLCFSTDGMIDLTTDEAAHLLGALEKQGRDPIVLAAMKKMLDSDLNQGE